MGRAFTPALEKNRPMTFTDEERAYLRSQPLARVATVALVIDDLVSFDPFIARGIRVYGQAEAPIDRVGMVGPGIYMKITPTVSWSWNMASEPAGETWYEVRRAVHRAPDRSPPVTRRCRGRCEGGGRAHCTSQERRHGSGRHWVRRRTRDCTARWVARRQRQACLRLFVGIGLAPMTVQSVRTVRMPL